MKTLKTTKTLKNDEKKMDIIRLLPDSVANQIAAGEVIQRPSSVIKELVENSADAGATDIKIYVKDAGKTLIQVVDNGKGMSETDARMAFERHATSKIKSAEDLFSLHTMGFRGEALPSICAISQVELRTRTEDSQMGTRIVINGSKVESQEPCICEKGTSISIRNLFFNLPARRKFLKSDAGELGHIMREFERMALVNNNLRLSIDTGSRILDLRPGSMLQRINDLWKNNLNMQLIPIDVVTDLVKIQGYISRPEYARRRNALWHLIANGRHINHLKMHKVITGCFENLIATDTQPCYFIKIQVDPAEIDINIHPSKNEVKLEREKEILSILGASIKAALGKFAATPQIDFDTDLVPVQSPSDGVPENPVISVPSDYNPFEMSQIPDFQFNPDGFQSAAERHGESYYNRYERQSNVRNWDTLYNRFMNRQEDSAREKILVDGVLPAIEDNIKLPGKECFQYADKYIITTSRNGVMIIDQHRAHLKILYEDCLRNIRRIDVTSQRILFPETLILDIDQQDALARIQTELTAIGFSIEYEEDNKWTIAAVPTMISQSDAKETVLRILESVREESDSYGTSNPINDIMEKMALVMARSAAITRGRKLSSGEMENLVGQLMSLPDPSLTPSGNRIFTILDEDRLQSLLN